MDDELCVCDHPQSRHELMSQCSIGGCECIYFVTWDEVDEIAVLLRDGDGRPHANPNETGIEE